MPKMKLCNIVLVHFFLEDLGCQGGIYYLGFEELKNLCYLLMNNVI